MVFQQSIRVKIIWRLALIFTFATSAVLLLAFTSFWLLAIWMILFCLLGTWELIRFIERDRRVLQSFLIAVNQNDFMGNVGISKDQKFLYNAYKNLSSKYREIATEKEANHLFLNTIVEHAGVPMIAFEETKQEIRLINDGAKELFNKPYFRKLTSLEKIDAELVEVFRRLDNGEHELYRFRDESGWKELSIVAKRLKLQGESYKLLALHNIKKELDEKELESWQKLIRVLTHEIKNSVIPISTLSELLEQMLDTGDGTPLSLEELSAEDEDDLRIGLKTIAKRSKGLAGFVNAYGEMAKVPAPALTRHKLTALLTDMVNLYKPVFAEKGHTLNLNLPEGELFAEIDREMIEQVLINLIKNALEALEHDGEVTVSLTRKQNYLISIADNGSGISPEVMENMFTPFYTTKKEGSGIGLSLSRQIIRKHQGDLDVISTSGKGTEFTIYLPIDD
ncbi:MAG: ATP-binding protein [Cyclobacteriaceae bacterium]